MKRVLFVDDETNVLDGLRRMLHKARREWEMHFVDGGEKALKLLEEKPMDVIVSDMRMPKMDGAELLSIVRERWPQLVRIVLSGHSERSMIMRAVASTHQFLAKPCEPEMLIGTVNRSCRLRELLAGSILRELFTKLQSLPCLPDVYERLVAAVGNPEISMEEVGAIISQDIGISAKVMQLVNTPFFGFCHHISSPAQAAAMLGIDTIKALVLSTQVFINPPATEALISAREFRDHSMLTAAFARAIAAEETGKASIIDHAFLGGLLHDVGLFVFANNLPQVFNEALRLSEQEGRPIFEIERSWLGATHAEVGAYVLALWGQPDSIVEAVAYHHEPMGLEGEPSLPVIAVHVAEHLTNLRGAVRPNTMQAPVNMEFLEKAGLAHRLPRWTEVCRQLHERLKADTGGIAIPFARENQE